MACEHKRLRCTDNVFYCALCGAVVPDPYKDKGAEEKPAEARKTGVKRKARKESKEDGQGID